MSRSIRNMALESGYYTLNKTGASMCPQDHLVAATLGELPLPCILWAAAG